MAASEDLCFQSLAPPVRRAAASRASNSLKLRTELKRPGVLRQLCIAKLYASLSKLRSSPKLNAEFPEEERRAEDAGGSAGRARGSFGTAEGKETFSQHVWENLIDFGGLQNLSYRFLNQQPPRALLVGLAYVYPRRRPARRAALTRAPKFEARA